MIIEHAEIKTPQLNWTAPRQALDDGRVISFTECLREHMLKSTHEQCGQEKYYILCFTYALRYMYKPLPLMEWIEDYGDSFKKNGWTHKIITSLIDFVMPSLCKGFYYKLTTNGYQPTNNSVVDNIELISLVQGQEFIKGVLHVDPLYVENFYLTQKDLIWINRLKRIIHIISNLF